MKIGYTILRVKNGITALLVGRHRCKTNYFLPFSWMLFIHNETTSSRFILYGSMFERQSNNHLYLQQ
jgi:hypothetical protein